MATSSKTPPSSEGELGARYTNAPSSSDGELARSGVNAIVADLNALSFSETSRSPFDGDQSRSQAKFRTSDGGKKS